MINKILMLVFFIVCVGGYVISDDEIKYVQFEEEWLDTPCEGMLLISEDKMLFIYKFENSNEIKSPLYDIIHRGCTCFIGISGDCDILYYFPADGMIKKLYVTSDEMSMIPFEIDAAKYVKLLPRK